MADEELPPPSRNGDLRLPRSVSMQKDDYYNYVELMCEDGTCDAAVHAPRVRTCIERTRVSRRDVLHAGLVPRPRFSDNSVFFHV